MFARRTTAALAALVLPACWPVIPGKADDYVLPDTALITGSLFMVDPIGGYWEDGTPQGSASWGVLVSPTAVTGLEGLGTPGTCVRNPEGVATTYRGGGSGTTLLKHNDAEVRMTWTTSGNVWFGSLVETDWEVDTEYDLAPLEFSGLGTFEIPAFFTTPDGGFLGTAPGMGGEGMGTVPGPDQFTVEWTSQGKAEWVVIQAIAYDAEQVGLELVACVVEDTGSFTIPAELWQEVSSTAYVMLLVGALRIDGGTVLLNGTDEGYVTSSAWLVQGAVTYGGAP
jgi:hypothetical protein